MAVQLLADLYECDAGLLNDPALIRAAAQTAVHRLGAEIVEECVHQFSPIGISYIAVITTSHFSIHTWPEYGYAAIDVFSCGAGIPETLCDLLAEVFRAGKRTVKTVIRDEKGGLLP